MTTIQKIVKIEIVIKGRINMEIAIIVIDHRTIKVKIEIIINANQIIEFLIIAIMKILI